MHNMHKIMVVDDEAVIACQMEEYLRSVGYNVVGQTFSGQASIDMARGFMPDLILMDIVMPGELDGIDAARIIKEELDIPVIFVTAYDKDEFIERAKAVEPLGYIVKPLQMGAIKAAIEIALHKRAAEEQIKRSLELKDASLRALHHRVRSNFEVISSLFSLQSAYINDKKDLALFKDNQNRVWAISLMHERLYESEDLVRVDMRGYIRDVTVYLYRAYEINTENIKLRINASKKVFLAFNIAIYCGLILNELVSNVLKHAFPEGRKGEVRIDFGLSDEDEVILTVGDNGVGMPKGIDYRDSKTLGLRIVLLLAEEQLGGKISLGKTKGTKFHIRFTVPK